MKIYIFGTGNYYSSVKENIPCDDIIAFLDNSEEKQGTIIDGKKIIKPEKADFNSCDYVLLLIHRYSEVYEQLINLGVPQNKIVLFSRFTDIYSAKMQFITNEGIISTEDWLLKHVNEKKVMLFCHELDRNGVSVVLMHLAGILTEMGYCVVVAGLLQGGLQKELKEKDIDSVTSLYYMYESEEFLGFARQLDFMVFGTIGVGDVVDKIYHTNIPIIWWMHESNEKDFRDFTLPIADNVHYYGGGTRVVECFKHFYPDRNMEKLLYFIPDIEVKNSRIENKLKVAIIGLINRRKGQDVFIKALGLLPLNLMENVEIEFIGKLKEPVVDFEDIYRKYGIKHIEELSQEELQDYYENLDVLVSPSRDDPMPVVVTQAMQNSVTCIVSDEVGQSEYITDGEDGFVFESEDYQELAEKLEACFSDLENTRLLGIRSRKIYEKYFSSESMRERFSNIITQVKG